MTDAPDIRPYLEVRTASPAGFSPDGSKLLVSSDLTGMAQLYRLPAAGGDLVQLTDLDEPVGGTYLPTSDRLLVVTDRGGNERYQLYLMDDDGGDLEDLVVDPDVIHRPGGMTRDGDLLAYSSNRRNGVDFDVHVRPLDPSASASSDRTVFAPGGWCSAAGFSPDGALLAASRLTERPGDNELHLVDRSTGDAIQVAAHPDRPAAVGGPAWLPDGSGFFFSTSVGGEFATIARGSDDGDWEQAIDTGWDAGCGVDWQGRHLLVTRNVDGYTRAALHDPDTLAPHSEVPLPGDGVAGGFRFSRDGRRLAFVFTSALVPGDTWVVDTDTGDLRRLTDSPCPPDASTFVAPTLERATAHDGETLPLFVHRPAGGARRRRPVIVVLHGGPEGQYRPTFSPLTQYLVARGFAVVAPNVRGSTGYGRRFEHLDDVAGRFDAIRDLEAVHDWIAGTDDLDPDRAALYGGSYGGYMVLAGLAFQPDRWAAGVSVVGISSLVTFLQNTAAWRRAFREREYGSLDDDRDLLEELSPITHIDRVRAPLMLVHGRNDPRVPLSEAEQVHRAVRSLGVRSELLVYDDEGHGLAKLHNRLDAYPRVAGFLTEELTARP